LNVWRIAVKELMVNRDVKMLIFMLAIPVVLILIMGTMLTSAFSSNVTAGEIRVLYISESGDQLEEWMTNSAASGVILERAALGLEESLREVQEGKYTGLLTIDEAGIHYYGNSRSQVENGIVNGLLTAYEESHKLETTLTQLASNTGAGDTAADISAMAGVESGASFVKETALKGPPRPSAMDYYAIAVTTMIIFYFALTAGTLIENERTRNTATRLLAAPISKYEILAGKVVGNVILNTLFCVAVVLISKYMFDANWGNKMWLVFLVIVSLIVFTISMGLGISYLIRGKASGIVIMTIIQLGCLFGGSYHQIVDNGDFISVVSKFIPIKWSNDAILAIIYGNESGDLFSPTEAILLNVSVSAVLLAVSVFIMRRKEGL
jgi:ABC-2 type transport system permease protein